MSDLSSKFKRLSQAHGRWAAALLLLAIVVPFCLHGLTAVVPLRKSDLFKGAIPSKIFEALALGKPLLLGVEGEAHDLFIEQAKAGIAFAPEDAAQLAQAIRQYHADRSLMAVQGANGARYVRERFDRAVIGAELCAELRTMVAAHKGTNA